jgi:hypothetical protein
MGVLSIKVGDLGINRIVSRLNGAVTSDNNAGKYIHASASVDRFHVISVFLANLIRDIDR